MLLFLVQPMIGKMILPQLGGTPAVWNTCMVFFQALLLIGYGYTHLLTTTQPTRRQVLIQGCLLFLPFLVLPFSVGDWAPQTDVNPIFGLMWKLCIMVGLPFFMVSTTAPLLQKWFFHTGHPAAKDPYFLYGASNFGSMLGLALYPTVVEPWLQVSAPKDDPTWETQVHLWTIGYAVFVGLVIGCAIIVWQALAKKVAPLEQPEPEPAPTPAPAPAAAQATAITAAPRKRGPRLTQAPAANTTAASALAKPERLDLPNDDITPLRRFRWVGLAAAASSLMLGVTTYITTDIAAIAFFWIIPLALYLLTFILVFMRWPVVWTGTPHMIVMFVQPCILLLLVLKMIANLSLPGKLSHWEMVLTFIMHLGAFFATTLMCHGELAKDRPSTKHLTEFYFWMSLGGVLGGLFNAFFAPIFFQWGIWEYMIAMAFACLLRSSLVDTNKPVIPGDSNMDGPTPLGHALDLGIPILIGMACYVIFWWRGEHDPSVFIVGKTWLLAYLVILTLALSLRPVRYGLSVFALFFAFTLYDRVYDSYLYEGRGFFGLLRVRETDWTRTEFPTLRDTDEYSETKIYRTLIHGGINHGRQIVKMKDRLGKENATLDLRKRREPITYFHQRNGVAELYYKLAWPKAEPVSFVTNMTGKSDARLPASMVGLGGTEFSTLAMLANTQSEPPFAVVGLGTGILACYAKPFQHVDIYEIDPLVKNLSIVPGYVPPWDDKRAEMPKDLKEPTFYFVHDAQERWAKIDVKLGDGRLRIKEAPENYYHIITLDAFSSDAIPVHLLTKDAVELYLDKLADGGVLLFNTTNRYVRIETVLSAIAEECDCDCLYCPDYTYDATDSPDRFSADWVVLQPRLKTIGARVGAVKGQAGLVIKSIRPGGLAANAGLKVGDILLELNGTPIKAGDRLSDLLEVRKLGETIKFLAKVQGVDKEIAMTLPTHYVNGGLPIRERLEEKRVRLAWNGRIVRDADGKEVVDMRWREVEPLKGPVWTDGYSNMLNPQVMPWIAPWRR